jgi:hypothetical protein
LNTVQAYGIGQLLQLGWGKFGEPALSPTSPAVRREGESPLIPEVALQYALLVYAEPDYGEALSEADREAAYADYAALADDVRCVKVAQLQSAETATSVRVAGGRTLVTDGPFADTKEVLGGFCLVEAADLDEAIELAARIPAVRLGGVVEVRPVVRL